MSRKTNHVVVGALALLAACATAPKPREVESLEKLRAAQTMEAARKRAPEIVAEAERLLTKAQAAWQSNDLDDARRDALLGEVKLKTAYALVEQDAAKLRISAANREIESVEDELGRAEKEARAAREQIALMRKLAEARASAKTAEQKAAVEKAELERKAAEERAALERKLAEEKEQAGRKLAAEQQRSAAEARIAQAELALKTADTVDAKIHAAADYQAAQDLLLRARAELGAGNVGAAATSAELAAAKADAAAVAAKPAHSEAQRNQDAKGRNDALGREASAIPGVVVRLERKGEVQRLVLPLTELFAKAQTAVDKGKEPLLDAVAGLLKKYPTYSLLVTGHTDKQGRPGELLALSQARAQSVFSALVQRGVAATRMVVSGQGGNEPVSDNKTPAGRKQNNRVEVIVLLQ